MHIKGRFRTGIRSTFGAAIIVSELNDGQQNQYNNHFWWEHVPVLSPVLRWSCLVLAVCWALLAQPILMTTILTHSQMVRLVILVLTPNVLVIDPNIRIEYES